MSIIGNPTELCKKLRQRTDKPHIYIMEFSFHPIFKLAYSSCTTNRQSEFEDFVYKVNPYTYLSIGESARDWHYAEFNKRQDNLCCV